MIKKRFVILFLISAVLVNAVVAPLSASGLDLGYSSLYGEDKFGTTNSTFSDQAYYQMQAEVALSSLEYCFFRGLDTNGPSGGNLSVSDVASGNVPMWKGSIYSWVAEYIMNPSSSNRDGQLDCSDTFTGNIYQAVERIVGEFIENNQPRVGSVAADGLKYELFCNIHNYSDTYAFQLQYKGNNVNDPGKCKALLDGDEVQIGDDGRWFRNDGNISTDDLRFFFNEQGGETDSGKAYRAYFDYLRRNIYGIGEREKSYFLYGTGTPAQNSDYYDTSSIQAFLYTALHMKLLANRGSGTNGISFKTFNYGSDSLDKDRGDRLIFVYQEAVKISFINVDPSTWLKTALPRFIPNWGGGSISVAMGDILDELDISNTYLKGSFPSGQRGLDVILSSLFSAETNKCISLHASYYDETNSKYAIGNFQNYQELPLWHSIGELNRYIKLGIEVLTTSADKIDISGITPQPVPPQPITNSLLLTMSEWLTDSPLVSGSATYLKGLESENFQNTITLANFLSGKLMDIFNSETHDGAALNSYDNIPVRPELSQEDQSYINELFVNSETEQQSAANFLVTIFSNRKNYKAAIERAQNGQFYGTLESRLASWKDSNIYGTDSSVMGLVGLRETTYERNAKESGIVSNGATISYANAVLITSSGDSSLICKDTYDFVTGATTPSVIDKATPPGGAITKDPDDAQQRNLCFDHAGSLGWIICPVINGLQTMGGELYENVVEPFLAIEPGLISTDGDNGTYLAWNIFRNFANIAFVIFFLFIIFSQVTGIGIDNYGVKKALPKVIIAALLINLSYVICRLAIDLSNVLGYALNNMLTGIGNNIDIAKSGIDGTGTAVGGLMASIIGVIVGAAILANGWAIIIPLLLFLLSAVLAILFFFVIISVRKAAVILMVAISPIAFVAYMLPNTKSLFDKWLKLFKSLLLVFPLCGILIGGGYLAARIILQVSNSENATGTWWLQLTAMVVLVIPFFFLPTLLKSSLALAGNIGAKIGSLGKSLSGRATGAVGKGIRNSERVKNYQEDRARERANRSVGRTISKLKKRQEKGKELSVNQKRRLAGAYAAQRKYKNEKLDNELALNPDYRAAQDLADEDKRFGIQVAAAEAAMGDANQNNTLDGDTSAFQAAWDSGDRVKIVAATNRLQRNHGLKGTDEMEGVARRAYAAAGADPDKLAKVDERMRTLSAHIRSNGSIGAVGARSARMAEALNMASDDPVKMRQKFKSTASVLQGDTTVQQRATQNGDFRKQLVADAASDSTTDDERRVIADKIGQVLNSQDPAVINALSKDNVRQELQNAYDIASNPAVRAIAKDAIAGSGVNHVNDELRQLRQESALSDFNAQQELGANYGTTQADHDRVTENLKIQHNNSTPKESSLIDPKTGKPFKLP